VNGDVPEVMYQLTQIHQAVRFVVDLSA
jgi:hypothetical protein